MKIHEIFEDNGIPSLFSLSIPRSTSGPEILDLQKALVVFNYDIGSQGLDGQLGDETKKAIAAAQTDLGLVSTGIPDAELITYINTALADQPLVSAKIKQSTAADLASMAAAGKPTDMAKQGRDTDLKRSAKGYAAMGDADAEKLDPLPDSEDSRLAKATAEQYYGKQITDTEWNMMIRATNAESANDISSYAMVMGSIINRVRSGNVASYGSGIIGVLTKPRQFQAVTGTSANGHAASPKFMRQPSAAEMKTILYAIITKLPKVSHEQVDFSATDPKAYTKGTSMKHLSKILSTPGSSTSGGSAFNTPKV